MPEISRFYGIIIRMRYNDHPPPHFHARFGDQEATIEIASGRVRGVIVATSFEPDLELA